MCLQTTLWVRDRTAKSTDSSHNVKLGKSWHGSSTSLCIALLSTINEESATLYGYSASAVIL